MSIFPREKQPFLGYGLGLRAEHYHDILNYKPNIDWFEILTENYLIDGGVPLNFLDKIRQDYSMVMHGVSLSIGSTDPLNFDYLQQVKTLADRIQPCWISDHLCWTGVNGINLHDLLPLPYTEETIQHVVSRVQQVQDFYGRQILLENVSSYISYTHSEMTEWEFLAEIAQRADCLILLDINNIYVSAFNHNFDPELYLKAIPKDRVRQFHLAGHRNLGTHIIDTHDAAIVEQVWQLYKMAVQHFGPAVATMIERDDNIPPLSELLIELQQVRDLDAQVPTHVS